MSDRQVPKGILSTIGNTPLIELERLLPGFHGRVYAKLERFNPGGSIKDRPAVEMLEALLRAGRLVPGRSVVVESSSGNLAVGLAQACRVYGLAFVCVVDARTTEQNLALLGALGATVEMVAQPDPETGEFLPARLRRVQELIEELPDAVWPNQYANEHNPAAHHTTMAEISAALDGRVDYLICAAGTTGTLCGCSAYIRAHGMDTTVVAVDAVGSVLYPHANTGCRRLIPGHGAGVRPALLRPGLPDRVVHVTDLDCVVGCRKLSHREAILAGGSSGALVSALEQLAPELPAGARCVLVLPDGGDRYLDTIYSDSWVRRQFGEVSHLWKDTGAAGTGKGTAKTC